MKWRHRSIERVAQQPPGRGLTWISCGLVAALGLLTACQHYEVTPKGARVESPKAAATTPPPSPPPSSSAQKLPKPPKLPKVKYDAMHDDEIKEIFSLASDGRWEEAEVRANALIARDPQDPVAVRVLSWIRQERERIREQAVENKIREISAKNSVFNPTPWSLLKENKDRGLPPRSDVRNAINAIEATPYIPPTYGQTNYEKGPLFDMESREGRMSKILDKEVSIHLDNATLSQIMFKVGQVEGINFVADKSLPAFKTKLSVNMDHVKLSEFLKYISRNLDLQFEVGNDLIWIINAKDKSKQLEETRFYKLRRGFILPAEFGPDKIQQTETIQGNKHIIQRTQQLNNFVNDLAPSMPAIERAITNFFTGTWMLDKEHNLIIARGTPDQLAVMDKIVQELDKPVQQVLIEARFITVSRAQFLRLGAVWESGRNLAASTTPIGDQTGLATPGLPVALPVGETFTNVLNRSTLTATLTAIEQGGESETLSAPRLTVVNNLPATINDGLVQYYYQQYTVKQTVVDQAASSSLVPAGDPVKITAGATLNVLASVGGDGKSIMLALNPQVNSEVELVPFATVTDHNSAGQVVSSFDIKLPQYRTEDLSTRVVVRSGQTVVMGGVLERTQSTYVESVPILGDLPIIGAAFRRRTELDQPRYLLIFVTATLLSPNGQYLIYDSDQANASGDQSSAANPLPANN